MHRRAYSVLRMFVRASTGSWFESGCWDFLSPRSLHIDGPSALKHTLTDKTVPADDRTNKEESKHRHTMSRPKQLSPWTIFFSGSAGAMIAETCTLPIDITKIRLQLQGEKLSAIVDKSVVTNATQPARYKGMLDCGASIVKSEGLDEWLPGVTGLYKGLQPALLRQCVYSGLRIGTYERFRSLLANGQPIETLPLWKKIIAGATTGAFAAAIATPTDLIKVRMQASSKSQSRYNGLTDAFISIARTEGLKGLWRGWGPTVQRAAIVNAAELSTYDHFKHFLIQKRIVSGDTFSTHLLASLAAGFVATLFSNPIDVMKTRIMNQKVVNGVPVYTGVVDCLTKTIRSEGFLALYKGFIPNYARLGP
ncbi:mitochondrial substrate carrier family protein ucpB-like, partial [Planoprotostelium fungivorum]